MAASADPAPGANWFWFRGHNLLWVWAGRPHPGRMRFTARWSDGPPAPLAEIPRRTSPGPARALIGVPAVADGSAWEAAGPDGAARFVAGPGVRSAVYRSGDLVVRWVAGKWARVGVAAVTPRGPRDYLLRREQVVPATVGEFRLPTDWLSTDATEVLVTPIDADGRRGPTERMVVPRQPAQLTVCFQHVYEKTEAGERRHRLRIEASAVGVAGLELTGHVQPAGTSFTLRIDRPNRVFEHPLPTVGFNHTVTVRVAGGGDDLECRYLVGEQPDRPGQRTEVAAGPTPRTHTYQHRGPITPAAAAGPPSPVSVSGAVPLLADDLLDTTLGRSLLPECRELVATLSAAALTGLTDLGGDAEVWRAVAGALGAGTGPVRDYLARPHEYDLLFNDPLVLVAYRVCPRPPTVLRSVRDLLPSQAAGGRTVPDYLDKADDAVIDLWLAGASAGGVAEELYELTATCNWRTSPGDVPLIVLYLRQARAHPMERLQDELLPVSRDPKSKDNPDVDPVYSAVESAVRLELKALKALKNSSATPGDVRTASANRTEALRRATNRLKEVKENAPAAARPKLTQAISYLGYGETTLAARELEQLRGGAVPAQPTAGMTFRVEAVWAEHSARLEAARDDQARSTAAWIRQLLADQTVPPVRVPADGSPDPTREWQRFQPQLAAVAVPAAYVPPGLPDRLRVQFDIIRRQTPDGPAADVLNELIQNVDRLAAWLAAPAAAGRAADEIRSAVEQLRTERARALAAPAVQAVRQAGKIDWRVLNEALDLLRTLADDERVWQEAAVCADGVLPPAVRTDTDAVARWVREQRDPPDADGLVARENGLRRALQAADCPLPADSDRPPLPSPGPRLLYPDEYAALARRTDAGPADRASRMEKTLRSWWPPESVQWLDDRLGQGQWDDLAAGAGTLNARAALQKAMGEVLLDGYGHDPQLRAFLGVRSVGLWVREASDWRDLVARLRSVLDGLAGVPGRLAKPERLDELQAAVDQLREYGPEYRFLGDLRTYLVHRLDFLWSEARKLCPRLPDLDVSAALAEVARCETTPHADPELAAALRAAGILI